MAKRAKKHLSRKEREYHQHRREILDAALRLFVRRGYHNTTMSDIAKEAEFSIGTIYSFFSNKEELYFTMVKEELDEIAKLVKDELVKGKTLKEKMEGMVHRLFEYFEDHYEAFNILAINRESLDWSLKGELAEAVQAKYYQVIGEITKLAERGIKEGEFKVFMPEEIALSLLSLINSYIFLWMESGRRYSLRDKAEGLLDIFYYGVFSSRRRRT